MIPDIPTDTRRQTPLHMCCGRRQLKLASQLMTSQWAQVYRVVDQDRSYRLGSFCRL